MRRLRLSVALGALLVAQGSAHGADDVVRAKTMFDAGAQAYGDGNFLAAIQAFEAAYKLSPRPGVLFSIAQAHRRQYFIDRRPERLQTAIARYEEYLVLVPQGGRRADVAQALEELVRLSSRLDSEKTDGGGRAPQEAGDPTRLMISTKVPGAMISFGGGAPEKLPFIREVAPGPHRIKVTADGYFEDERAVLAVEGGIVAVDIPLRDKPARLVVTAEERSQVAVDGRPVGMTPLSMPVQLPAGHYVVTVAKAGRRPFSVEVDLARDERREVAATLETTGQRWVSLSLMGAGVIGAVTGAVFAGLAIRAQDTAERIQEERGAGGIDASRRAVYTGALEDREDLRKVAGGAFSVAAAVGGAGVLLYLFDLPSLKPASPKDTRRGPEKVTPAGDPLMEVSVAPEVGPGVAGVSVTGRF